MSTPVGDPFGQLLRRYRLAAGYTQERLAALSGLGVHTIADLERGISLFPHAHTVESLADALHLTGSIRASFASTARRSGAALSRDQEQVPTTDSGAPAFVGRVSELAAGVRFLAGDGPSVLLFAGEPGIGKSRLLRELAAQAHGTGWHVVAGGCDQRSGREPYAPFVEMLDESLLATSSSRRKGDLKGCDWLARLGPEFAAKIRTPVPEWLLTPEQQRRMIFAAVRRYLTNIAGPAGTLLILDDVQWAGSDALDLLAFLVRLRAIESPNISSKISSPHAPLRVLGAYRTSEVQSGHALENLIVDLAHDECVSVCELARLSDEEARSLATSLVGATRDAEQRITDVVARADGVPFYLVNFAQAGAAAAPLAVESGAMIREAKIPWLVTATIRRRLSALPSDAQETLALVAIVGRVAQLELLRLARGSSGDDLAASLEAACRARLLEELSSTVVAYRFTHDLIRETVFASLSKARQALLHRAVADTLEQLPAPERTRHIAVLADHLMQAGELARALPYLLLAGDQAEAVFAHGEAAGHYRAASELARGLGDAPREAKALEKLGTALWEGARRNEAREVSDRAACLYETLGDRDGELRALADVAFRYGGIGEVEAYAARILPRLQASEANVTAKDASGIARVYFNLAILYFMSFRRNETLDALEHGELFARMVQDDSLRLQMLLSRPFAMAVLGIADPPDEVLQEILALAERLGDIQSLLRALVMAYETYWITGDFSRARRYLEREMELLQNEGNLFANAGELHVANLNVGHLALLSGDWGRARQVFDEMVAIEERNDPFGEYFTSGYSSFSLGILDLAMGHEEAVTSTLEPALARALAIGDLQALVPVASAIVEADLLAGRTEAAQSRLAAVQTHPGMQYPSSWSSFLTPLVAWADLILGHYDEASKKIEAGETYVRARGNRFLLPDILRVRAQIALTGKRWDEVKAALDEACSLAREMPYPYAELKALWIYGWLEAARWDPTAARQRFEQALAICDRLGEGLYRAHIMRDLFELPSGL